MFCVAALTLVMVNVTLEVVRAVKVTVVAAPLFASEPTVTVYVTALPASAVNWYRRGQFFSSFINELTVIGEITSGIGGAHRSRLIRQVRASLTPASHGPAAPESGLIRRVSMNASNSAAVGCSSR